MTTGDYTGLFMQTIANGWSEVTKSSTFSVPYSMYKIHESLAKEVNAFGLKGTLFEPGACATEFGSPASLKHAKQVGIQRAVAGGVRNGARAHRVAVSWATRGLTYEGVTRYPLFMRSLALALRILAIAFLSVSALHLATGMQADAMLGAPVSPAAAADPSLDSQNRFYGVTFSLLGITLLIGATDLRRYEPIVVATLGVLFAAGLARAVSWAIHGAPSSLIIGIMCADLLLPPLLYSWLKRSLKAPT